MSDRGTEFKLSIFAESKLLYPRGQDTCYCKYGSVMTKFSTPEYADGQFFRLKSSVTVRQTEEDVVGSTTLDSIFDNGLYHSPVPLKFIRFQCSTQKDINHYCDLIETQSLPGNPSIDPVRDSGTGATSAIHLRHVFREYYIDSKIVKTTQKRPVFIDLFAARDGHRAFARMD